MRSMVEGARQMHGSARMRVGPRPRRSRPSPVHGEGDHAQHGGGGAPNARQCSDESGATTTAALLPSPLWPGSKARASGP